MKKALPKVLKPQVNMETAPVLTSRYTFCGEMSYPCRLSCSCAHT